jgi:hypothetical protein
LDELERIAPDLSAAFAGEGGKDSLNAHLRSAALATQTGNVAGSDGTVVHTTSVVVDAFLPWMEIASATDAPDFDLVPPSMHPPWLRTVLRHSCLYEHKRIRTVSGHSWWPSRGAEGLGSQQGAVTKEGAGAKLSDVYYERGPSEKPTLRRSRYSDMIVMDPQTMLHGVRAYSSGDSDGSAHSTTVACGDDAWRYPVEFPGDARLV